MNNYHKTPQASRGVTLNTLKDELCALNMRLLLAMEYHNEAAQEEIKRQMEMVQAEIDRMCLGSNCSC